MLLLLLAALAGGGAWLATQPAAGLPAVQVSGTAALGAKAKVAAGFGRAAAAAFITRRPQEIRVELTDDEITSLVAQAMSGPATNPLLHGTGSGVFFAAADMQWQGLTLQLSGTGTVSIDASGRVHPTVLSANVGRLPVPAGWVQSLADESAGSEAVPVPPGVVDLALQPVDGGAVLTGTANPV